MKNLLEKMKFFMYYEYILDRYINLKIAIEECIKQYYSSKITKLKGSTPVQYRINPY